MKRPKKGKIILDLDRELNAGEIMEKVNTRSPAFNQKTLDAIREVEEGRTIVCENIEEYLKKVSE